MEIPIQKENWVDQLESKAKSSIDDDEKKAAAMLTQALSIEQKRIERIKKLARLLLGYKFASPSIISGGDFVYAEN